MKLVLLSLIFVLVSCLGGGGGGGSSSGYNYAGPGSNWKASFTGSNFTLTESDDNLNIKGTYTTLSSGFKKLTVSSATGTGAPSAGEQAYGLDVPGVVFLLKPLSANSEIISMVAAGNCPTSSTTMNWIVTKKSETVDDTSKDLLGTFTSDGTTANIPARYALDGTSLGGNSLGSITCSNGKATISTAEMFLTSSGGAIVRTGYDTPSDSNDDGIILAMPGESISSGDMDGNFVGLVFTSSDTNPVKATVSGTSVSVQQIDPETGSNSGSISDTLTISAFDSPSAGFLYGTLSGTQKVRCNANSNIANSNKGIIFCSGNDSSSLFALLLIEK